MYKQSYGHDIVGALLRGAGRRIDMGVHFAFEGAKRFNYGVDEASPDKRFAHVLGSVLRYAGDELGISEDELRDRLRREADSYQLYVSDKSSQERRADIMRSDPSDKLDWDEYDKQVDEMREEHVRDALKKEARLRRDALLEVERVQNAGI